MRIPFVGQGGEMGSGEEQAADIVEIFRSFQGEGLSAGSLQTFVRFAGCDRACRYCDTPASRGKAPGKTSVHMAPGKRWTRDNPWTPSDLAEALQGLGHGAVCLTGGEPLLQSAFLAAFLLLLPEGRKVHLETHGLLASEFKAVSSRINSVSACAKLPSATGQPVDWDAISAFLDAARGRGLFVKTVITADTEPGELDRLVGLIAAAGRSIPLVLQPVTPTKGVEAPGFEMLLDLASAASAVLDDVRVIPQVHALMGWK